MAHGKRKRQRCKSNLGIPPTYAQELSDGLASDECCRMDALVNGVPLECSMGEKPWSIRSPTHENSALIVSDKPFPVFYNCVIRRLEDALARTAWDQHLTVSLDDLAQQQNKRQARSSTISPVSGKPLSPEEEFEESIQEAENYLEIPRTLFIATDCKKSCCAPKLHGIYHLGVWQAQASKVPTVSRESRSSNLQLNATQDWIQSTPVRMMCLLVTKCFAALDPEMAAAYRKAWARMPRSGIGFWGPNTCNQTFAMMVLVLNEYVKKHRDLRDSRYGWCAVFPFQRGDIIFIRSFALEHFVRKWKGIEHFTIVFKMHQLILTGIPT
ncbi:hypothetical protein DFJ77DRAFT_505621 [Powellomyces hirtus]|nr:hypothetical protein DFJ77DRAFT_505621 [Powellomyces hirtus]